MQKIIVSWIAWFYDFNLDSANADDKVNLNGPTYDLHKHFYADHHKHVLLSTGSEGELRSLVLRQRLQLDFPDHRIDLRFLDVNDIFGYRELKAKGDRILNEFKDHEIDILFSNGTTPMRTAWVLLHLEGRHHTHLIQGKSREIAQGASRFPEIILDKEIFPYRIEARIEAPASPGEPFRDCDSLRPVYDLARKIALVDHMDLSTLIRGESGTGKELLARFLHNNSARLGKPFVAVNCSSIGRDLLESRLFGHKEGTFTGAKSDHKGFFEAADGGTLFLDEIGDIHPEMQQALLRALQEKEITPVGATEPIQVDVRIIAATNQPLEQMCERGEFRWDLYWRLNITELELPSLRNWYPEDRKRLIDHLLRNMAAKFKKRRILRLDSELAQRLLIHPFPGNIRELENMIANFYVFAEDKVTEADLPAYFKRRHESPSLLLEEVEKAHIHKVLEIFRFNKTQTCKALGIRSVNTLKEKMRKYGIDSPVR